ncbi:hypothetical protein GGI43DRAFT_208219 [Trichoderma evansii]
MQNVTQNPFPADNAEENNINNDIFDDIGFGDTYDDGGMDTDLPPLNDINLPDFLNEGAIGNILTPLDDIGLTDVPHGEGAMGNILTPLDDIVLTDVPHGGGMDTALIPPDLRNETVAGGTEGSSATSDNKKHRPSEEDDDGNRKPGYMWCNGRWYKIKGGSFSKHLKTHNPDLPCVAYPEYCSKKFPTKKELDKHYRTAHKVWADLNGIPDQSCSCEACGKDFTRSDNLVRHLNRFPECREKMEQMKKGE